MFREEDICRFVGYVSANDGILCKLPVYIIYIPTTTDKFKRFLSSSFFFECIALIFGGLNCLDYLMVFATINKFLYFQ